MLGAVLALGACAPQAAEGPSGQSGQSVGVNAPTEVLTIETHSGSVRFNVEIADDEAERNQGLMFRAPLPDDRGMLFHFQTPENATFWMHNTPSSLDLIFIGVDGRILNIADHATPYSDAPIAASGLTRGVLEIRAGRAEELGIRPGDRVRHRIFPS
ncbi:hypothetical protein ATE48_00985 [Candidatus Viadribacter manganicus]|uniref:DUF192 domain-containing protein n=2 Tax=Candidatus Viadribacter manganicus TaxID=1759059 RepID=A0A1B1AMW9_9PROT|nr:hypothetical protein ATE48_00985 [Candidatus Viadribacter manganicus]